MDFDDIKQTLEEKPWLLLIPVAGVVGIILLSNRGQSAASGTTNYNSAPGSLAQPQPTVSVGPDMLANAIQGVTEQLTEQGQQTQEDIASLTQGWSTQIAGLTQQLAEQNATSQQAIAQASQGFAQQIQGLVSQMNQRTQQQTSNMSLSNTSALQARNHIGDANIVSYFSQFKLPSWIGLQYVAENKSLPEGIPQLEAWLNTHGYRNPNNGKFTAVVSAPKVPNAVQAELIQAYGAA